MSSEKQMQFRCFFSLAYKYLHTACTVKTKCCFRKLFGYCNCMTVLPCANSKNVVLVKHFVGR